MLTLPPIKGKRVTVFGLGMSGGGVGTARFLADRGAREIIVTDVKRREELTSSITELASIRNITYVLGQHRPEDFLRVDLVVKNPIIPWTNEYVRLAEGAGVPVEMDSSLFFAACRNPVIGVTGTRGKTTTASLIAHILESSGIGTARVGISQGPVLGAVSGIRSTDTVVFELSSWRLSALGRAKVSPTLAVVTNVYPDHLNYYRDMDSYIRDKRQIFEHQTKKDAAVFNADNPHTSEMAESAPGAAYLFSREDAGAAGVFRRGGLFVLRKGGTETEIFSIGDVSLPGEHNRDNAAAAALAAILAGAPIGSIAPAIRSFRGVPHRIEFVAERGGVRYYDDTAATSPDGAIAALRSFESGKIILIAGGADKDLQFSEFASEIAARTKGTVFFAGTASEAIRRDLKGSPRTAGRGVDLGTADSMGTAVRLAADAAVPGDIVLLSPGAASFGLFRNEFDRGDRFKTEVGALPESSFDATWEKCENRLPGSDS